jgi:glyoxylase-like metal-dependent hydrolase (beta-lactamase superfamily II)
MLTSDFLRSGCGFTKDWLPRAAACTLIALAAFLTPAVTRAVGRLYEVREVKPHVFVWLPEDIIEQEGDPQYVRAGNAGFVITGDGVVVVDATNSPFHAREMLYEIRQKTDQPVRYLIDTGDAGDEVLGNEVFADLQVQILSSPAIQGQIRSRAQALAQSTSGHTASERLRGIHITPPNQTFQGEDQFSLGGQTIKLIALDSGLQAVAVSLPAAKVVFLGDLYQNQYFPRLESRDVHRWIDALRQAESWNAEVYVPGHGEPSGPKEVAEFRHFLEWLTSEVQTRLAEGKSLDQVKQELGSFTNYPWHAHELAAHLVEGLYQQLAGGAAKPKKQ